MKKVFLVLALVAAYGVSMAMSSSNVVTVDEMQVTIVADMDDNNVIAPEGEKEKEKKETAKAKTADAKAKPADAKAKGEGCGTAKSEGCSGKAEKSACGGK